MPVSPVVLPDAERDATPSPVTVTDAAGRVLRVIAHPLRVPPPGDAWCAKHKRVACYCMVPVTHRRSPA